MLSLDLLTSFMKTQLPQMNMKESNNSMKLKLSDLAWLLPQVSATLLQTADMFDYNRSAETILNI